MEYISNKDRQFHKRELAMAIKDTSDKKMFIRYRCVYLYYDGREKSDIANIFGIDPHTVNEYIKSYKLNGLEALEPQQIPGAPEKLTEEQKAQLKDVIVNATPADVGFNSCMNWTASLALQWVKREFGVEYTNSGMTELMHRLNLSYTRPTYSLAKADKKEQAEFCESFEVLKKSCWREK